MYDIPELEKKWKKYKKQQIKKPIFITVTSLIIISGLSFALYAYLNNKNSNENIVAKKINIEQNATIEENKTENKKIAKKETPAIIIQKEDNSNSNELIKIEKSNNSQIDLTNATIIKPKVPDDEIRVIGFDSEGQKDIKEKYSGILIPKQKSNEIVFKEKIAELEENFKESQDPNDSLEIAKLYYKHGNFKKAEDWAVNTNNLDGDIEESWLIFAKARVKQGNRVDAIKVLQSFYDETNSIKAKKLLDAIRRGKKID